MEPKLISYKEISQNDEIVLFEIELEKIEIKWFKIIRSSFFRKGYFYKNASMCYYSNTGEMIDYSLSNSIITIIKSDYKTYKF